MQNRKYKFIFFGSPHTIEIGESYYHGYTLIPYCSDTN